VTISSTANPDVQSKLDNLASATMKLIERYIPLFIMDVNKAILLGNTMMSAEIRLSNSFSLTSQSVYETENNLATYDVEKCISLLKKAYNITNSDLIISKIEKNSNLKLDNVNNPYPTNSVLVNFYNAVTFQKLNATQCNSTVIFGIPVKDTEKANMTKYRILKNSGIEMYNSQDDAYNNICKPVVDNTTNADTSITWRRTSYFAGKDATCNGCKYLGIDDKNRVQCSCNGLITDFEYKADFVNNTTPFNSTVLSQTQIGMCVGSIGVIIQ
jgi:hypothetical protein